MPIPVTLLVAHPKELIRAGLRAILAKSPVKILGEALDAKTTPTLVKEHKPAVVLLDFAIPGGDAFELLKTIRTISPATKVVVLSALENPTYMARASAAGATDFLMESLTEKELTLAIESAAAGKRAKATRAFAQVTASLVGRPRVTKNGANLTPRESQVLSHVAFELSNEEIAHSLTISVETAKEHMKKLLRKLAVNDRTRAAVWAVKEGMI